MCRRSFRAIVVALLLGATFAIAPVAHAQIDQTAQDNLSDLRRALRYIGTEYADSYVQPITDAFGANMNAGLFRTADVGNGFLPLLPFQVYVGVNVSAVQTKTLDKRFPLPSKESITEGIPGRIEIGFTEGTDSEVPTAFGETETPDASLDIVSIQPDPSSPGDSIRTTLASTNPPPGLVDVSYAPLPVPQVGIGSVAGTDVQLRYFPTSKVYGYGQVSLFGLAVRHDIDQWFPAPLPINIAVQGSWNQFSLASKGTDGEFQQVLDASGWAFNVHASRSIPVLPIVLYTGVQYEKFTTTYSYEFSPPNLDTPIEINLDQTAANTFRGLAGVAFNIPVTPIRLNVDYAFGSNNNVVTAGFGVKL